MSPPQAQPWTSGVLDWIVAHWTQLGLPSGLGAFYIARNRYRRYRQRPEGKKVWRSCLRLYPYEGCTYRVEKRKADRLLLRFTINADVYNASRNRPVAMRTVHVRGIPLSDVVKPPTITRTNVQPGELLRRRTFVIDAWVPVFGEGRDFTRVVWLEDDYGRLATARVRFVEMPVTAPRRKKRTKQAKPDRQTGD